MATTDALETLTKQVDGLTLDSVTKKYPNVHPDANIYDLYRAHLANVLSNISGVASEIVFPAINWTTILEKGDFVVAVPAFRVKGTKPDALAKQWSEEFPADDPFFQKPTVNGVFLTFWARPTTLASAVIPLIRTAGKEYGGNPYHGCKDPQDPSKGKKKMIVEFSSPNVAKPFHAGHLRSTIIGSFIANLYEASGWEIRRQNYLGDWGKQYGLLALAYEKYGDAAELERDPIDHLFKLYVQISAEKTAEVEKIEALKKEGQDVTALEAGSLDEQARGYFRRMTDRDEEVMSMWQKMRDLSIVRYKETYARLNIRFDEFGGESQVTEEQMAVVAQQMTEKNVSQEDGGAVLVNFEQLLPGKEGKRLGKALVQRRDGTALYLTRDISELLNRWERFQFDKMIYVVGAQQDLHVAQFFKIVELIGRKDVASRCQHINFGQIHGMSTRRGTVKFLNDILNDCGEHMHNVMRKNEEKYAQVQDPDKTADIMGISAVMVQDMMGKRINNYHFNMDAMTSFEGDTGPYLQYAHARLCSIKRKANLSDEDIKTANLSLLTETHASNVVRMLAQYPDVLGMTLKTHEPTTVLTYLFKFTHVISSSYEHLKVVGQEPELMKARMALYDASRIVLSNAMGLLGLTPLDRM